MIKQNKTMQTSGTKVNKFSKPFENASETFSEVLCILVTHKSETEPTANELRVFGLILSAFVAS